MFILINYLLNNMADFFNWTNEAMKYFDRAIEREKSKQKQYKREFMTEEQLIEREKVSGTVTNSSEIL